MAKSNFQLPLQDVDDATDLLAVLVQELEDTMVEADDSAENEDTDDNKLDCEDDDEDGLDNGHNGMLEEEVAELEESIVPVWLMLTKVNQIKLSLILSKNGKASSSHKHNQEFILPQWLEKLEDLGLKVHIMPWDVSTCWNSTFNMLNFTLDYCVAIDGITSNQDQSCCYIT